MYKKLYELLFLMLLLPLEVNGEEVGRENLSEAEAQINVSSYRPTFPEIQLGYAKKLKVDESGTVYMDTEAIQGFLNAQGLLAIEAVRGEGDTYFVMEKGGYILSIQAKNQQIVSEDDQIVQIELVDWLYGRNGLVDDTGFKSNLVPQGFLPKTGIDTPIETGTKGGASYLLFYVVLGVLLIYLMSVQQRRGRGNL